MSDFVAEKDGKDVKDSKDDGVVLEDLLKDPKVKNYLDAKLKEKDEESKKAIEEAKKHQAQVEKDKLYPSIKELQEKLNLLTKQQEEDSKRKQDEAAIRLKEEEDKKKASQPLEERLKSIEAELIASKLEANEVKKKASEIIEKSIALTKEELRKKDVEIYIKDKISEAFGEIIPELVVGNTVEEVDASVEKAKKRYEELIAKKVDKDGKKRVEGGVVPVDDKGKVINKGIGSVLGSDVWNMSDKEFKAYEQMLLDEIKK